ncbi:hypothetical protein D3C80_1478410 [compost metagenome]
MVLTGRLEILANRHEIHVRRAKIVHQLQDFVPLFAKADHDAGFGEDCRIEFLHTLQQTNRVEIARARTNLEILRRHCFQIVIEHIRACLNHDLKRAFLTQEVWRQNFNRRLWRSFTDCENDICEMLRTTIGQIVTIN